MVKIEQIEGVAGVPVDMIELVMFDLDGTLISSYMQSVDRDFHSWEVLPGRLEVLKLLRSYGIAVSLITNQAGVAFGHVTEQDVVQKLGAVAEALDFAHLDIYDGGEPSSYGVPKAAPGLLTAHVAYEHPQARLEAYREDPDAIASNRRKPSGVMIQEALNVHSENAIRAVYVGDRPEDEIAARNAGVRFVWAEKFFNVE